MAHRFKSSSTSGRWIDTFVFVVLIPAQVLLLLLKLADHHVYSWWLAFIPLYILCIPLLLIAFGVGMATRQ